MHDLVLNGCRTSPLGGYLSGVGLLRVVTRTLDPDARGCWREERFTLISRFESVDALVDALAERFEPEAIVSPWNAGSGFAANGKNASAERLLQQVRDSTDARLVPLRTVVGAGDNVVAMGRAKGWGGKGDDLWDKARKPEVLQLCRNTFPDDALPWVDAAVALGAETEPTYSRLLGTGGNFGRQDLSVAYLNRALSVLVDKRSHNWLRASLTGDETVPYLRDAVGQFDPAKAGGIQSSPWEKGDDKGFVNPWKFLLTLEGSLLFAGAVVRRLGAQFGKPALPFQVHGSTGGFASGAHGESTLGEIWLPEWPEPAGLEQVRHLLAEGRAEWRNAPARSSLDFVRAVASLGVDRGIEAFSRHVFVDRLGQSPLAVPAGRVRRQLRGAVGLLGELDQWLTRLRGDLLPTGVATEVRRVEQRLFDLATGDSGLVELFVALGRLVEAVGRSGTSQTMVRPLSFQHGNELLTELRGSVHHDLELRLALAFATAHDSRPSTSMRSFVQPVSWGRGWEWTRRPAPAPLAAGFGAALVEVARRRAFPRAVPEMVTDQWPGVRGPRLAYAHGVVISSADRHALVRAQINSVRLADLLAGLLCVEWPSLDRSALPGGADATPDPALDILVSFTTSDADPLLVRPGADWPALLAANRVQDVLDDARHRLRVGGCRFVVRPTASHVDAQLLAASLLLRSDHNQRRAALDRTTRTEEENTQ